MIDWTSDKIPECIKYAHDLQITAWLNQIGKLREGEKDKYKEEDYF